MKKKFQLEVPGGADKVLLHTCCAPCSSAIIECLMQHSITPVIYYCNPNIYPLEEYNIRKDECTRYARSLGLEIVDADYDHEAWRCQMSGMEQESLAWRALPPLFQDASVGNGALCPRAWILRDNHYAGIQPMEKPGADRRGGTLCHCPLSRCYLLGTELA